MVRKNNSERPKHKVRGRPFEKGNIKGKPPGGLLAAEGHTTRNEGIIKPDSNKSILEPLQEEIKPMIKKEENSKKELSKKEEKISTNERKSILATQPLPLPVEQGEDDTFEESKILESLEFRDGTNCLKICLIQKPNRMFRVQIFLNEQTEIRPVSYTGARTAMSYWNLLKKSMNQ